MAVHAANGTLTASTVSTTTLTSWQKYVIVKVTNGATAGSVSATVDGSTPTLNGADTTSSPIAANATLTFALLNKGPRPDLSTTTPLATDPSAVPAFTTAQTVVKLLSDQPLVFNIELSSDAGSATVLA